MERERILWITNVPAPYRVPVWSELGRWADLFVAFHGRQQRNRPPWALPEMPGVHTTTLETRWARDGSDTFATGFLRHGELGRVLAWNPTTVVMTGWGDTASVHAGVLLRMRQSRPLLVAYYGSSRATRSQSSLVARLRRRYFRGFDSFVTYGSESSSLLREDGVDPSLIVTGFNSVDVHALHHAASTHRSLAPEHQRHPAVEHRFLFAGQLIHRKAPDLVVAALADPRLTRCSLSIVGAGPMERRLIDLTRELDIVGRVSLLGVSAPEVMPAVYAHHDTLVLPSRAEVWGLVVNEALASGLHAVVSTRAGCAADVATQRGVHLATPTVRGVADAMVASVASWRGVIDAPEMLSKDATRMSRDVREAIALGRERRAAKALN